VKRTLVLPLIILVLYFLTFYAIAFQTIQAQLTVWLFSAATRPGSGIPDAVLFGVQENERIELITDLLVPR
jgi:hypothetical protein